MALLHSPLGKALDVGRNSSGVSGTIRLANNTIGALAATIIHAANQQTQVLCKTQVQRVQTEK